MKFDPGSIQFVNYIDAFVFQFHRISFSTFQWCPVSLRGEYLRLFAKGEKCSFTSGFVQGRKCLKNVSHQFGLYWTFQHFLVTQKVQVNIWRTSSACLTNICGLARTPAYPDENTSAGWGLEGRILMDSNCFLTMVIFCWRQGKTFATIKIGNVWRTSLQLFATLNEPWEKMSTFAKCIHTCKPLLLT